MKNRNDEIFQRLSELEKTLRGTSDDAGLEELTRDIDKELRRVSRVLFGNDTPTRGDGIIGMINALDVRIKNIESGEMHEEAAENRRLDAEKSNKVFWATVIAATVGVIGPWIPKLYGLFK